MSTRGLSAVIAARRRWTWIRRGLAVVVAVAVLYVAVGLIPVNRDFVPTPGGVEIYVVSNVVHADLILPIEHGTVDWRAFLPETSFAVGWPRVATHVAIGWGDRGFFLNTPTWADLRPGTAGRALLWPSDTCMHVSLTRPDLYPDGLNSVVLSEEQYARLAFFVRQSFDRQKDGPVQQIPDAAYGDWDAFFAAKGRYHAARNCNNWAGSALRSAGVTVPWYTPVPKTMFLYLP